jgi:hypothetical protein
MSLADDRDPAEPHSDFHHARVSVMRDAIEHWFPADRTNLRQRAERLVTPSTLVGFG